jgi:hypothetical protein
MSIQGTKSGFRGGQRKSRTTENTLRKAFADFMNAVDAGAVAERYLALEIAKSFESDINRQSALADQIWGLYALYSV